MKRTDSVSRSKNEIEPMTSVDMTFYEGNGATNVVVVHGGWGDGEEGAEVRDRHYRAWEEVLAA